MSRRGDSDSLQRLAETLADRRPVDWLGESGGMPASELEGFELLDQIGQTFDALNPRSDPPLPFDWGPLTVLERLDEGSFGVVYRARDRELDREVALKLRKPEGSSRRGSTWLEEGRRLAGVKHPNVLTVHGAGRFDEREGIWTDLLEGESLRDRLQREGPLGPEESLSVATALCRALAALHGAGIVHADVKPANVVRERGGRFVLVDLGSGYRTDQGAGSSSQGSPLTSAPEVLRGTPPTPQSDLYSLGATLYQLLTGRPPYEVSSFDELMERASAGRSVPLRDRRPELAAPLIDAIERALDPDPDRRYRSAGEMERALRAAADEAPKRSRRPPLRWLTLGIGLGAAALLAIALRPGATPPGSPLEAPQGPSIRRLNVQGIPWLATISPDGRYVAYLTDLPHGREIRLHQLATGSDVTLAGPFHRDVSWRSLEFSPDGAFVRWASGDFGIATLWEVPLLGGTPRQIVDGVLVGPTYSPDGREAAFVVGKNRDQRYQRVDVISLRGSERRTLLELDGYRDVEGLRWSPLGDRLVLTIADERADHLMMVTASRGDLEPIPGDPFFGVTATCWSPDGEHLLVIGSETAGNTVPQPWLLDLDSGERRRLVNDVYSYAGCSPTADGTQTATVRRDVRGQIWVVPVDEPTAAHPVTTSTGRGDGVDGLTWFDDQTILYVAAEANVPYLWSVPVTGGPSTRWTTTASEAPSSAHGGPVLFESGWSRTERQGIYRIDRPGETPRRISPTARWAENPTISPDGRQVLYGFLDEDRLQLVRTSAKGGPGNAFTDLHSHAPSFSPDGTRVALHATLLGSDDDYRTAILDAESGALLQWVDVHSSSHSPWASDDALFVSLADQGVHNIYRVELGDPTPRRVTFFENGEIFALQISPDQTHLAVARGEIVSDVLVVDGLLPVHRD